MEPQNLLVLMSDQHNPRMMGSAGHEIVKTPNLDALAARGTRYTAAYSNCPICVPARASFMTGQYVHRIGYWDNAMALLQEKLGPENGDRFAWFTGTISGHQSALVSNHLEAVGSTQHYVHEVVNNSVSQAVNRDMFGEANPRVRIDKAANRLKHHVGG